MEQAQEAKHTPGLTRTQRAEQLFADKAWRAAQNGAIRARGFPHNLTVNEMWSLAMVAVRDNATGAAA